MDIQINVVNQKLRIASNLKYLVSGTQEFVRFVFNLSSDWSGLTTFVQFQQNGTSYNQYLDSENSAYLPSEIVAGKCNMMLYGSGSNTIATTNYLTLDIEENNIVSDAQSTDITLSLYNQMVNKVNEEITRAQAAENTLNGKITDTKASTVTFTNGDADNDAAATSWTANVGKIASSLTHANLFNRISTMAKNVRYLYNLLGDTDISSLSTQHTVTGALSKLNTDIITPTLVDDCDNATDPRVVYYAKGTTANRPDTTIYPSLWWFVRPFARYGSNDIFQIATPISSSAEGSVVYTRSKVSNSGWTTWRRMLSSTDLTASAWTSIDTQYGTIRYKTNGYMCELYFYNDNHTRSETSTLSIATLPTGACPTLNFNNLPILGSTTGIFVYSNGTFYITDLTKQYVGFHISYFVK